MENSNNNAPAFACVGYGHEGNGLFQEGLTKREYFAGLAMSGLLTNDFVKLDVTVNGSEFTNMDLVAKMSVAMADALLKEIEK